jgi:RimJ/RimL family protein N-acetyltransferase
MTSDPILRDVTHDDLSIFFEQQRDESANYMAAFGAKNPADRDTFMARWARNLPDDTVVKQTIVVDGQVAGHIVAYEHSGMREVGYWLGKPYWGQGIATRALAAFLEYVTARPLFARAAKDNIASLRVLEKCGFTIHGEDKGFSDARGEEVEEYILTLGPSGHDGTR